MLTICYFRRAARESAIAISRAELKEKSCADGADAVDTTEKCLEEVRDV